MEERRKQNIFVENDRRLSFEKLLENVAEKMKVIVLISRNNDIIYANKTFYEKSEYSPDEVISFSDLFTDEHKEIFLERTQRRLTENELLPDVYMDLELKTKTGKAIYLNVYPNIVEYNGIICVVYIALDSTEYTRTRKVLNQFFEYCPMSAFIKDSNNRIVRASRYYYESTGTQDLSIIGKTTEEIWPKDISEKLKKEDDWVYEHKQPLVIDEEINGKYYVKTKFPINGILIGGFSVDITDRVQKRKILEESEKKYKELYDVLASFLNNVSYMVWIYDKNKNIMFSNKALKDFLDDIDIFETEECMVLPEKTEVFVKEYEIRDKKVTLEITKIPLFDDDGNVVGCNGTVKDITETVRLSNNLIKKIKNFENGTMKQTKETINKLNSTIENLNERREINGR